jgi:hypothetical protein
MAFWWRKLSGIKGYSLGVFLSFQGQLLALSPMEGLLLAIPRPFGRILEE